MARKSVISTSSYRRALSNLTSRIRRLEKTYVLDMSKARDLVKELRKSAPTKKGLERVEKLRGKSLMNKAVKKGKKTGYQQVKEKKKGKKTGYKQVKEKKKAKKEAIVFDDFDSIIRGLLDFENTILPYSPTNPTPTDVIPLPILQGTISKLRTLRQEIEETNKKNHAEAQRMLKEFVNEMAEPVKEELDNYNASTYAVQAFQCLERVVQKLEGDISVSNLKALSDYDDNLYDADMEIFALDYFNLE